jgi:hypothetical protein
MPFHCGKRSAGVPVVLGLKQLSTDLHEHAAGFFKPAPWRVSTAPLPYDEGLLKQPCSLTTIPTRPSNEEVQWILR